MLLKAHQGEWYISSSLPETCAIRPLHTLSFLLELWMRPSLFLQLSEPSLLTRSQCKRSKISFVAVLKQIRQLTVRKISLCCYRAVYNLCTLTPLWLKTRPQSLLLPSLTYPAGSSNITDVLIVHMLLMWFSRKSSFFGSCNIWIPITSFSSSVEYITLDYKRMINLKNIMQYFCSSAITMETHSAEVLTLH